MAVLPFVALHLALAVAAGLMASYAWGRRYYRSGRPLALLMAAIAWWLVCRAFAAATQSFEGVLFWLLLQFAGIILIMPTWLILALSFAGHWWRRRLNTMGLLYVPALIFLLVAVTNSFHGLWWTEVEADTSRTFLWLTVVAGPVFSAHTLYAYLCFSVGVGFLVRTLVRSEPADRTQAWLMLCAAMVPVLGNMAFLSGAYRPYNDDPTPILLLISAVVAFYATMHFRVVDLNPLVGREALAALPDGMVVIDNQSQVAEINEVAAFQLETSPDSAVGRPLAALLVGTAVGAALRPVLSSLARPATHNVTFESAAGPHTLEVRTRPLLAANGAVAGAVLLLRDVSERVHAEQIQAQHLAELSLITRVARAANSAADANGMLHSATETIAAAGLWERVAVGLLEPGGQRLAFAADVVDSAGRAGFAGLALDGPVGLTLVALLRAGRHHSLNLADPEVQATPLGAALATIGLARVQLVPLFHQGEPIGLLVLGIEAFLPESPALVRVAETVAELITDAVVRARLYDEAREADRIKALFLASVSHELRTPLTSIIGYVEMLQKGAYGPIAEVMREPFAFMRQSSTTLLRMINDILDFSRAEAGHLRVELQPVDLLRTAANVVGQLRPQIAERGLDFSFEIPPGLPLVQANPVRLEQVLTNLLSNAVKFTDAGSVTMRAWQHDNSVSVSIADTGIGVAPEHLKLIFQEFRRVETSGRRVGGTGLGLAISRRLLALMGATIAIASTPGVGSTFTITLPMTQLGIPAALRAPTVAEPVSHH